MITDAIRIIETTAAHVEAFHRCVGVVARERKYSGLVDAPPLEASRAFVQSVISGGGAHFVAIDGVDDVVGWCDIARLGFEGFRHTGRLGMGLLPHVRGGGVGWRLAEAAIDAAHASSTECTTTTSSWRSASSDAR